MISLSETVACSVPTACSWPVPEYGRACRPDDQDILPIGHTH